MKNRALAQLPSPDCSSVTKEMLQPLTVSRFYPDSDGITRIPYTLFGQRRFHIGSVFGIDRELPYSSLPMPNEYADFMTKTITDALAVWTKISDNKVIFYQADPWFEPKGIRFHLATAAELGTENALALTAWSLDNSAYVQFSDIYLPVEKRFWEDLKLMQYGGAYNAQAIHHEIMHAMGISNDWPADASAMLALKDTTHGAYCSVMPYQDRVASPKSICPPCNPPFLTAPGPIDKAMFDMTYNAQYTPSCYSDWKNYSYHANVFNDALICALTSTVHGFVVGFGSNLSFTRASVRSIPLKAVHLVADVGMLGFMIGTQLPAYECAVFGITAATKYLPDCVLNKLPTSSKWFLTSSYALFTFGVVQAIRRGHCVAPLIVSAACNSLCIFGGTALGRGLGWLGGNGTSYVVRKVRYAICKPEEIAEPDLENSIVAVPQVTTAGQHWWSRLFSSNNAVTPNEAERQEQALPLVQPLGLGVSDMA